MLLPRLPILLLKLLNHFSSAFVALLWAALMGHGWGCAVEFEIAKGFDELLYVTVLGLELVSSSEAGELVEGLVSGVLRSTD